MGTAKDSQATRARLIQAAGSLFAEKGFKGVTVREIAAKAKANLSALNYHFKTKEALYREAVLEACESESFSERDHQALLTMDPSQALRILISQAIKYYQAQPGSNWQTDLLTKECWQPTNVFPEAVRLYFKPQADLTAKLLGIITGRPADEKQILFAVVGLFGLIDTYALYGQLNEAIAPGLGDYLDAENRLVELLFRTTLQMCERPAADSGPIDSLASGG